MVCKPLVGGISALLLYALPARADISSPPLVLSSTLSYPSSASERLDASLEEIRRKIPPSWSVRLPKNDVFYELLHNSIDSSTNLAYSANVFVFDDPPELMVSLFRCDSGTPSCRIMSIAVEELALSETQTSLQHSQSEGRFSSLSNEIDIYWVEETEDVSIPSSISWQQDGFLYTVSGSTDVGTEDLMGLAQAIAQSPPINQSLVDTTSSPSSIDQSSSNETLPQSHTLSIQPPSLTSSVARSPADNSPPENENPLTTFNVPSSNLPTPELPPHPNLTNHHQSSRDVVLEESSIGQMTSVSQLDDVQPTDWAFQALQSLVERYGVVAGYPDGTYRGNRVLSRYEFAAGLNAVLNRLNELLENSLDDRVTMEDLEIAKRLETEFQAELATLQGRIDSLEARTDELEAQQFSTTVKLYGDSIMGVVFPMGGDPPGLGENNPFLAHQTQLSLAGSLNDNNDFFRVGLTAANFDDLGAAGPNALNTNMALLSFQSDTGNAIELSNLDYRFAAFDKRVVFTVQPVGFSLGSILSSNSPISSGGREAISRFATESPLFKIGGLDSGVGADWLMTDRLRLQLAYGSRNANRSDRFIHPLLDDNHNAFGAQFLFTPVDSVIGGIAYINSFAEDGRLDTGTGSFNADISGGIDERTRIHGFNGTLQWRLGTEVILGAWGGLTYADSMESSARAGATTYGASISFPDTFGREGDLLGLFFGQPLKLVAGERITPDDGTSHHLELFYRFRLSDNISMTPGIFCVTDPGHIEANDDICVGTIRTRFRF